MKEGVGFVLCACPCAFNPMCDRIADVTRISRHRVRPLCCATNTRVSFFAPPCCQEFCMVVLGSVNLGFPHARPRVKNDSSRTAQSIFKNECQAVTGLRRWVGDG